MVEAANVVHLSFPFCLWRSLIPFSGHKPFTVHLTQGNHCPTTPLGLRVQAYIELWPFNYINPNPMIYKYLTLNVYGTQPDIYSTAFVKGTYVQKVAFCLQVFIFFYDRLIRRYYSIHQQQQTHYWIKLDNRSSCYYGKKTQWQKCPECILLPVVSFYDL